MENFKLHWPKGKKPENFTEQIAREYGAEKQLRRMKKEAEYQMYENELPRTEYRRALTEVSMACFEDRLRRLGISKQLGFSPGHSHFFDQAGFDEEFPADSGKGGLHGRYGLIAVVEDAKKKETALTLFHEMAHAAAIHKYVIVEDEPGYFPQYRIGYEVADAKGKLGIADEEVRHFLAFNEGVVESTAVRMLTCYQDTLQEKGLLTQEEKDAPLSGIAYRHCVYVVTAIVEGLAQVKGVPKDVIWNQIEKGQYTGEMMWMRDLDKVFGAGSLRVLDCLAAEDNEETKERNSLILQYFQHPFAQDAEVRQNIREQLY